MSRKQTGYRIRCHLCVTDFEVPVPRDDAAWGIFQEIIEAHRDVSPTCRGGRDDMQVIKRLFGAEREKGSK